MAELDLTNIAAASVATPAAGVQAVYAELTSPAKRLSTKDDAGAVINYIGRDTTDTGAGRLTNKDLDDLTTFVVDSGDVTKKITFSTGGATTSTTLTIAEAQSTSQTLNVPNITASSIIVTDTLAQTITGVKTMTNVTMAACTTSVPNCTMNAGTLMTTPTAGVMEFDGTAFYCTTDTTNGRRFNDTWNYFRLTGSGTGITTIADFFGANDGIPLVASGVYEIEWICYFSQATAGTATWTITTATTALANLTGEYIGSPVGGIGAVGTPQTAGLNVTTSSAAVFPVTGTEATAVTHYFRIRVVVTAGAGASNTRLRLTMSAGTATPLINSYFRVRRLAGANAGTYVA